MEREPLIGGGPSARAVYAKGDKERGVRMLKANLQIMPTSVAGLALGVCGLGITWQTAAEYLLAGPAIKHLADVMSLVSFNIGVTLLLLYLVKCVVAPRAVLNDALSLDGSTDLPCLPMAGMMVAWWLHVHGFSGIGWSLWQISTGIYCLLLLFFFRHIFSFSWTNVTPGWALVSSGLGMAAGTGAALGAGTWIDAFFWLSFSAFVVVFPAVLYRVHAHPTLLEDHHQLQYPLLAAPAAVLLIAWIALGGHQGHALTHFLFLVLMTSVVLVSLRLPFLATLPFHPAASTAAFPADVAAKAAVLYTHLYQASNTVMVVCSWFFVSVATAVVSMLSLRFVILLFSRFAVPGEENETFDVKTNGVRRYSSSVPADLDGEPVL